MGLLGLQGLPAVHSCRRTARLHLQGASRSTLHICPSRFKTRPHSLSKRLTSFQGGCYKRKRKQSVFPSALSVSPQSLRSSRHSFSCLIYFILKGLSLCITRTAWKRVSDVCQLGFLLLFVNC